MKKFLMAALLSSTAAPALAGPMLVELLGEGASWDGTEVNADGRDSEIYTDITIKDGSGTSMIKRLELSKRDGVILLDADEVSHRDQGLGTAKIAALNVNLAESLVGNSTPFEINDVFANNVSFSFDPEICGKVDQVVKIDAKNVEFVSPMATIQMSDFMAAYDIIDPTTDCVLDLKVSVNELQVSGAGVDVSMAQSDFEMYMTLFSKHQPQDLGQKYTAELDLRDASIAVGGVPQAKFDAITSSSTTDAKSFAALAASDYSALMEELSSAEFEGRDPILKDIDLLGIWNAMLETRTNGEFILSGMEVTGDMPMVMTGTSFLQKGRTLDLESAYSMQEGEISWALDVDSKDLFSLGLGLDLVMTAMDEGMSNMGPRALAMAAPVSLSGLAAHFEDQGLSKILKSEMGLDPYAMISMQVTSNLGPKKGEIIEQWLINAQNGGASFQAAPTSPLPVMAVFAGFMGDWKSFGNMLNATSK